MTPFDAIPMQNLTFFLIHSAPAPFLVRYEDVVSYNQLNTGILCRLVHYTLALSSQLLNLAGLEWLIQLLET